jgi:hypothetical protein
VVKTAGRQVKLSRKGGTSSAPIKVSAWLIPHVQDFEIAIFGYLQTVGCHSD